MKRGGDLKRKTRLAQQSRKRLEQNAARASCRAAVIKRDNWRCRGAGLIPDHRCAGPLDVHEVLPRSRGGDPLDPDACIAVCREAHGWLHEHPIEAKALGLLE